MTYLSILLIFSIFFSVICQLIEINPPGQYKLLIYRKIINGSKNFAKVNIKDGKEGDGETKNFLKQNTLMNPNGKFEGNNFLLLTTNNQGTISIEQESAYKERKAFLANLYIPETKLFLHIFPLIRDQPIPFIEYPWRTVSAKSFLSKFSMKKDMEDNSKNPILEQSILIIENNVNQEIQKFDYTGESVDLTQLELLGKIMGPENVSLSNGQSVIKWLLMKKVIEPLNLSQLFFTEAYIIRKILINCSNKGNLLLTLGGHFGLNLFKSYIQTEQANYSIELRECVNNVVSMIIEQSKHRQLSQEENNFLEDYLLSSLYSLSASSNQSNSSSSSERLEETLKTERVVEKLKNWINYLENICQHEIVEWSEAELEEGGKFGSFIVADLNMLVIFSKEKELLKMECLIKQKMMQTQHSVWTKCKQLDNEKNDNEFDIWQNEETKYAVAKMNLKPKNKKAVLLKNCMARMVENVLDASKWRILVDFQRNLVRMYMNMGKDEKIYVQNRILYPLLNLVDKCQSEIDEKLLIEMANIELELPKCIAEEKIKEEDPIWNKIFNCIMRIKFYAEFNNIKNNCQTAPLEKIKDILLTTKYLKEKNDEEKKKEFDACFYKKILHDYETDMLTIKDMNAIGEYIKARNFDNFYTGMLLKLVDRKVMYILESETKPNQNQIDLMRKYSKWEWLDPMLITFLAEYVKLHKI